MPVLRRIFKELIDFYQLYLKVEIFFHRGKGSLPKDLSERPRPQARSLLELLPAKLRAYAQSSNPSTTCLVVSLDADDDEVDKLYGQLAHCFDVFSPGFFRVIGIATEEFEAWLLGDPKAVLRAYPDCDKKLLYKYPQDEIIGTWEYLAKVILHRAVSSRDSDDYYYIGAYKMEWSERIGRELELIENRSPSLQKFVEQIVYCLRRTTGQDIPDFPFKYAATKSN